MDTMFGGGYSDFAYKTVGAHPGTAAVILAALVVLTIVLVAMVFHYKKKGHEGLAVGPVAPPGRAACPPNRTVVTYQDPDGSATTRCVSAGVGPSVAVCGRGWDPAASAEAEALATVGALGHSPSGEDRLMSAADAAFDSRLGISDEALMQAMHHGGTP